MTERALIDITQTRSASDYAALFKKYADRTEWDDDALMAMFKRRLKDSVKDELMRYGGISSGLGDLIRIAIELDDKIYLRLVEKRGTKPKYERTGFAYGGRQQGDRHQPTGDPMELDAVQVKRTFKGKKPVSGGKETRKCYACGKAGHIARDCRSKNKVERRQFDMVDKYYPPEEREEEDSEPWEEVSEASDNDSVGQDTKDEPREDNRAELDQQNELIDQIERTLGSNSSEEKELPSTADLPHVSEHYQRIWKNRNHAFHAQFRECEDPRCDNIRHLADHHKFHDSPEHCQPGCRSRIIETLKEITISCAWFAEYMDKAVKDKNHEDHPIYSHCKDDSCDLPRHQEQAQPTLKREQVTLR